MQPENAINMLQLPQQNGLEMKGYIKKDQIIVSDKNYDG